MPQIKHVVHLMLENRSLDNLLGWLYAANQNKPPLNLIDVQNPAVYHGLTGNEYNVGKDGERHYINVPPPGNLTIPPFDPHEVFKHVHIQCYTSQDGKSVGNKPEMGGFYQDYESMLDSPEDIMLAFTPDELPVLNGLARNFAVCDKWYASVPSQTFCNRAFAATGNSVGKNILTGEVQGWVDNSIFLDYTSTTHWEVLSRNGKNSPDDWMIYYSQKFWWSPAYCLTRDLFRTTLGDVKYDQHFAHIDDFFTKAATGKLPSYSFLEPNWGLMYWQFGIDGTDYHPPGNVCPGEVFVKKIYDALSQGPSWNETLLIITFDEHGGTYDHIPVALNAAPPTSDKGQYGFKFDTFGVRVPAMLISPWVPQGAVFRMPEGQTPFDHTAVIATLLNWFGIDRSLWNMGARVAAAPTFENVLCLDKPRTDIPVVTPPVCPEDAQVDRPVTDLHHLIAARSWRYGQERKV
ncbi:MAG TPA: alkaline phosphatase family protein [Chitinophaga sp.]|uniref:alkaline phosphatase family protein n=1 Tax=Chitinophaga sp. TaxID=1869181 RepID=UPI002C47A6A9|nr:alkaline phosphatase family protein [Chitinophaga sp.]HVI47923.1 alkaline phosphatase family protein [Chitinophaga sp.]